MSVLISGALINGAGVPMAECKIYLDALVNTSEVVIESFAVIETDAAGQYAFDAQKGKYTVHIKQKNGPKCCVGDISVYDDSKPGTLNDFLTALDEGDLKPDVVKRFEEMVTQAQQSTEAAAESERQAGQHVADAQQIKSDCETLADNVQQNAEAVAEDKKQVAQLASSATQDAARAEQAVKDADATVQKAVDKLDEAATLTGEVKASAEAAAKSEQNAKSHADNAAGSAQQTAQDVTATETARDDAERFAENARQDAVATAEDRKATAEDVTSTGENAVAAGQSAQDAAGYARAAEQAKTDIDITLAGTLKTVNHLSEIAAAGTEAQQESRDNLGLKSAATMEPQSDTHDRTPGRLAVPGMFGFGKIFSPADVVRFNSEAELLRWAKQVTPGEYFVNGSASILPGVVFQGMIRIRFLEANRATPNPPYTAKAIIFYGVNGDIYYNRYWSTGDGWLTGWINLKVNEASLRALIETRAPLNSPTLAGTPRTPTPPDDAAGNEIANAAFVRKLLAALVDSSPETLDTLNELAAALGNDPNFATTVTNALAGKQPLNGVLTAISNLNERSDNLLYFNQDGDVSLSPLSEKARSLLTQSTAEAMRTALELKASATMAPQSSIYDRTEGRLAMPGAFGYGRIFSLTDVVVPDTVSDLSEWIKTATPGQYFVSAGESPIPRVGFRGVLEVIWLTMDDPDDELSSQPERRTKSIFFYGDEGAVYRNHYVGGSAGMLVGWENMIFDASNVTNALRSTTGNLWGSPDVDGLIFAAYFGESDADSSRKMKRGQVVPGSRLGTVTISARCSTSGSYVSTPQFITVSPNSYPQAGSFIALSGSHLTTLGTSECFVGLFMRVN